MQFHKKTDRGGFMRTAGRYVVFLFCAATLIASAQTDDLKSLDLETLQQRATAGDASAQAELSDRYWTMHVDAIAKDSVQSLNWAQESAEQGNARGEYLLGRMYEGGAKAYASGISTGMNGDLEQAVAWYGKSASQGYVDAQLRLALFLRNGIHFCQDLAGAAEWYRKAADQGNRDAELALGRAYEYGEGIPKDLVEARNWYQKSEDQKALQAFDSRAQAQGTVQDGGFAALRPEASGCAHGDTAALNLVALGETDDLVNLAVHFIDEGNYKLALMLYKRAGYGAAVSAAVRVYETDPDFIQRQVTASYKSNAQTSSAAEGDFSTISGAQMLKMLENAASVWVNPKGTSFTRPDKPDAADKRFAEMYKGCNGTKTKDEVINNAQGEDACLQTFRSYEREALSNPSNKANLDYVMNAVVRGCGLYAPSDDKEHGGESCGLLGSSLYALGNFDAAKAVWDLAPGCYSQDERTGYPTNGCVEAMVKGRFDLPKLFQGEPERLALLMWKSCQTIHDRHSCVFLKEHGATTVDMAAVEAAESEEHEAVQEFRAENIARSERERADAEARRDAFFSALQSLPGANDPLAIIHAANQQGAAIRAIGDANAARQQESAQVRLAEQQAAAQAMQQQQAATQSPAQMATSNNTADSDSGSLSSERCPNMQPYPDFGEHCNPVQGELSCVRVLSTSWNPPTATGDGMLRVTFENVCTHAVRLTVWGPAGGSNTGALQNVEAGAQYVFGNDRQQYKYQADDGIDCFGNNSRPGCAVPKE